MAYKFNPLISIGLDDVGEGGAGATPGATPGGSDTQVQFNDGGSFGGSAGLTFDGFRLFASAIGYFNRRPVLHRGPLFYKTGATTISITAGSVLNGAVYSTATAVTMPGSFTNNIDYAIWQHPTTGALVADASFTSAPAGATGGSIVGGFHYIPSGRPTAFDNGSPTGAAEILEFSLWDLTYRPSCADPRGMACIEGGFWMDLYLCGATSYAGSTFSAVPSSKIGLTIADGSSAPLVPAQYGGNGSTTYGSFTWYEASEMAASFGKRLPFYAEFAAAAYGAPEASSTGSDPGTVQWERVSKFGLAQATGTLWQWGADTSGDGSGGSWSASTEGRGSVYSTDARAVVLGGAWFNASNSGSRFASWANTPWNSTNTFGARFAAEHLVAS
ncbi:tail protein [Synechococcus phage S-CBS3]|uniref:tail protein n=1 Tax=Synechococcus phage S-CBS3 TaxID=753085 RepID=UPI000207844A|nr:tail protein [Synechococcus phage S-CBS3]ADF42464.1 major tropism determinant [Synechococcus phage S-CBS3]